MAKTVALARSHIAPLRMADYTRAAIVGGCGIALALAGPLLPL